MDWTQRYARSHPDAPVVQATPETRVLDLDDDSDSDSDDDDANKEAAVSCPRRWREWLESHPGRWVLKDSEANRGQAVHFVDSAVPRTTTHALKLLAEGRAKCWVAQRYVASPLLASGRKFHLRVHALAIGDVAVWTHAAPACLPASAAYACSEIDDMFAHATNHCVNKHHPGRVDGGALAGTLTLAELAPLVYEQTPFASPEEFHKHVVEQLQVRTRPD